MHKFVAFFAVAKVFIWNSFNISSHLPILIDVDHHGSKLSNGISEWGETSGQSDPLWKEKNNFSPCFLQWHSLKYKYNRNVSSRLHCLYSSVKLNQENLSEVFIFSHLTLFSFTHSTKFFQIFKIQVVYI